MGKTTSRFSNIAEGWSTTYTCQQLVDQGRQNKPAAVTGNIDVVGHVGSAKSTLLNCLYSAISKSREKINEFPAGRIVGDAADAVHNYTRGPYAMQTPLVTGAGGPRICLRDTVGLQRGHSDAFLQRQISGLYAGNITQVDANNAHINLDVAVQGAPRASQAGVVLVCVPASDLMRAQGLNDRRAYPASVTQALNTLTFCTRSCKRNGSGAEAPLPFILVITKADECNLDAAGTRASLSALFAQEVGSLTVLYAAAAAVLGVETNDAIVLGWMTDAATNWTKASDPRVMVCRYIIERVAVRLPSQ